MVRNTRQREAIKAAFERADRPLSPGQAQTLAGEAVPGLGISTVYRTIAALVEEGWLHTVRLPGEPDRYETAGRQHHHHFHCTLCGGVFDVEGCPGGLAALAPPGFRVLDHEVILKGWCAACARSKKAGAEPEAGHVHTPECLDGGCGPAERPRRRAKSPARSRL